MQQVSRYRTVSKEYRGLHAAQRDMARLSGRGWRVINGPTPVDQRAGCLRILALGIFAAIFKPKPHFLVTYERPVEAPSTAMQAALQGVPPTPMAQFASAEAQEQRAAAFDSLSPLAVRLHTVPIAGAALGGLVLLTTTGLVLNVPLWWAAGALYFLDWHNVTTLHGRINWPLLRDTRGPWLYWVAVVCLALFLFIPAGIYLVQCMQMAGKVQGRELPRLQGQTVAAGQEQPPADPRQNM